MTKDINKLKEMGLEILYHENVIQQHLTEVLDSRNLDMEELWVLLNLSKTGLNNIITDKCENMNLSTAIKLSKVLNVKIEDLFTLTDDAWYIYYPYNSRTPYYVDLKDEVVVTAAEKIDLTKKDDRIMYDMEKRTILTKKEFNDIKKNTISELTQKYKEEHDENPPLSIKYEWNNKINNRYVSRFVHIGKHIEPNVGK